MPWSSTPPARRSTRWWRPCSDSSMDDPVDPVPELAPAPEVLPQASADAERPVLLHDLTPPTRGALAMYAFVRGAVEVFCRLYWRLTVRGAERIPADTPFILAPVHRSNIDTLLVSAVTRRRMRYMGKGTVWKFRWAGGLITALGAVPVRRGSADRGALRVCQEILQQGEPLVMFPEGTRQSGP